MIIGEMFVIRKVYYLLRGDVFKVFWKFIVGGNYVFFKIIFIIWLMLRGRVRIKDILRSWNVVEDIICLLCEN